MVVRHLTGLLSLVLAFVLPPAARLSASAPEAVPSGSAGSVLFIENAGQWPEAARFQVWGGGPTAWLAEDAIWLTIVEGAEPETTARAQVDALERFDLGRAGSDRAEVEGSDVQSRAVSVRLSFPGANPHPRLEPFERLDTHISYFIGADPERWQPDVPVWRGARYIDLYPGVDLELTGDGAQLVQRIVARPGADLSSVQLRVEGADAARLDGDSLYVETAAGALDLPLLGADSLQTSDLSIPFAAQHTHLALPAPTLPSPPDNPDHLLYGTFVGGSAEDQGLAIAVDSRGSAYVTGFTVSANFPTTPGAFDTHYRDRDAYVFKLNPAGSKLVYATFLGGDSIDMGNDIAVDRFGNAYIAGEVSYAGNYPTTPGAWDTRMGSWADAFVTKLGPTGSTLVYSTFLGGDQAVERGLGIAVDSKGYAYVTGSTRFAYATGSDSSDFPVTSGVFDTSYNGVEDAFVTRLSPAGSALAYSTFLGGRAREVASSIAVGANGYAYVTGSTVSPDFPTTRGAFDTSYNGGQYWYWGDGFVVRLAPSGEGLAYSTFVGGQGNEWFRSIAVDGAGSAYVTGYTGSVDFPVTPGAFDTSYSGALSTWWGDSFVAKLNLSGSNLAYATYLGGNETDWGGDIAVDAAGNAYVSGETYSADFPTTPGAFDTSYSSWDNQFMVIVDAAGSSLRYGTFLGYATGNGVALDRTRSIYLTGYTPGELPTTPGAFDASYSGGLDAYVLKLTAGVPPAIAGTVWRDLNGDATRAPDEPGIAGVEVCAQPFGQLPVRCTRSGADGRYLIALEASWTHLVAPSAAPPGMQLTTPGFQLPVVPIDQTVWGVDFGYR